MLNNNAPLQIHQLQGLGVVVEDIRRSMAEFSRFFGIEEWQLRRLVTGREFSITTAAGAPIEATLLWATGGTRNLKFTLIQPVSGNTIFRAFLDKRGSGVQDITTHVLSAAEYDVAIGKLARDGIKPLQTMRFGDALDLHYLDTVTQLGTLVNVLVPRRPSGETLQGILVDEVVRFNWPPVAERLDIQKPFHVCVLTQNRRLSVQEGFRRIFGIESWFEFDNESGVTSSGGTYMGKPANSRFRLACGRRENFSVEVVEMMFGDNVYQDMLDSKGEGIHHVMTTICDPSHVKSVQKALEPFGYTIVQDGAAGPIYYGYLAAQGRIADLAVEVLCPLADNWMEGFGEEFWAILKGPDY